MAVLRLDAAGLLTPDAFVTADDITRGKPDPEPYLIGAEKLGVDPSRCLVVEDAPAGLQYPGDPSFPGKSGLDRKWLNFAPRVGLAWQVTPQTVIRAGEVEIKTRNGDFVQSYVNAFFHTAGEPLRVVPGDPIPYAEAVRRDSGMPHFAVVKADAQAMHAGDTLRRLRGFLDVRLAASGNEQTDPVDALTARARTKVPVAQYVQHRLQLARRPGQQHDRGRQ